MRLSVGNASPPSPPRRFARLGIIAKRRNTFLHSPSTHRLFASTHARAGSTQTRSRNRNPVGLADRRAFQHSWGSAHFDRLTLFSSRTHRRHAARRSKGL